MSSRLDDPAILFVDHSAMLGGAELYLLDAARNFPRSKVLLFEDGPFRERLAAAQIDHAVTAGAETLLGVRRAGTLWPALHALPSAVRLARRTAKEAEAFDVIYANSQKALIVCAIAGRLSRTPLIWNLHDILTAEHFSRMNRRIAVLFANMFADHVIHNSEATRTAFGDAGGCLDKSSVVYNGIEAGLYEPVGDEMRSDIRAALGIGEVQLVGVFSRLAEWKGQHVLVDALRGLDGVHALIVGDAIFQDDFMYRDRLKNMVREAGVEDRVHFLGFRDDIPSLIQSVDIVLHTSVAPEPFGRVIVEGMLAQKPVIAAKAGGAAEIIVDRESGMLVQPGDSRALAQAIESVLGDAEFSGGLAAGGYSRARKLYSLETMIKRISEEVRTTLDHINR